MSDPQSITSTPFIAKQLKLTVLGTSVTQIPSIKEAAEHDLGISIKYITLDGAAAQRRCALQPHSFDIYDQWFHDLDLVWPTGSLQPIDTIKLYNWEEIKSNSDNDVLSNFGFKILSSHPLRQMYVQLDGRLGSKVSDKISMLPTVHNSDGYAVYGNSSKNNSWSTMLDDRLRGKVMLNADPAIGALDMLLAMTAKNEIQVKTIKDLTITEIENFLRLLSKYKEQKQFYTIWTDEADAIDAFAKCDELIGSLWWSGAIKLRAQGVKVKMQKPVEGYRGWCGGLSLSSKLNGEKLETAYRYLNWWLSGEPARFITRNGAYLFNQNSVRKRLEPNEWGFWYSGKAATKAIIDNDGNEIYAAGEQREGGNYGERMGYIKVWNTVMTEHNFLQRKWEQLFGKSYIGYK